MAHDVLGRIQELRGFSEDAGSVAEELVGLERLSNSELKERLVEALSSLDELRSKIEALLAGA
jgi:hypothetical protein